MAVAAPSTPYYQHGSPIIFFDSHPEEQDSYLSSWYTWLKRDLTITFTGQVERFQDSGELRLKWYTHEGNEGIKDYPLHEYEQVRRDFDIVLALPEVRRVTLLGFPAQNPYILVDGKNPWVDRFKREKGMKKGLGMKPEVKDPDALDIDTLIAETEIAEKQRLEKLLKEEEERLEQARQDEARRRGVARDRFPDEEEGLLSGRVA